MQIRTVPLAIDYASKGATPPSKQATLTVYELPVYGTVNVLRPAVLICPGGAYAWISEREAEPVAASFLAAGCNAYVLSYTVAESGRFPCALIEAFEAIRLIRGNASDSHSDPNRIWICGFSAGGHLAASAGILWNHPFVRGLGFPDGKHRPDGMILGYPVITSGTFSHRESIRNLLGESANEETLALNSLERQVTGDVPPTFLWHTAADQSVPVQNSLFLADALIRHRVETEVHIYPRGEHGLSTARYDVLTPGRFSSDPFIRQSVPTWMHDAIRFIFAERT